MSAHRKLTVLVVVVAVALAAARAMGQEPRTFDRNIASRILGEDRRITISLPANYDVARRRYPVLYVLDGDQRALFDMAVATTRFDFQLDAIDHAIPPYIVVGIHQKNRGVEFGRSNTAFFKFLSEEVVGAVDKEFRTSPARLLVGHSLAGEFAIESLCRGGRMFFAVIAISPAISDSLELRHILDCLTERSKADSGRLTQLFFSSANRARDGTEAQFRPQHLALQKWLADSAVSSLRWKFLDLQDVSHSQAPLFSIPQGVWFVNHRSVWEPSPSTVDSIFAGKLDPLAAVEGFYSRLSERVGFTVAVEGKWLRIVAQMQASQRKFPLAISTARRVVDLYPEDLEAHLTLADVLRESGDISGAKRILQETASVANRLAGTDQERRERLARLRRAEKTSSSRD